MNGMQKEMSRVKKGKMTKRKEHTKSTQPEGVPICSGEQSGFLHAL